jgi:hypothetical protein
MLRNRLIALLAVAAIAFAPAAAYSRPHPSPTPSATPPPPPADPKVTKLAIQQFVAWQAGVLDKKVYSSEVVSKMTDDKILDVSKHLGALGPLSSTEYIGPFRAPDIPSTAEGYIYQMHCAEGNIYMWMVVDQQGKLATVFFRDKLNIETVTEPAASSSPSPEASPRT